MFISHGLRFYSFIFGCVGSPLLWVGILWFRRVGAAPQDYPLVRGLLVVAAFLVAERGL